MNAYSPPATTTSIGAQPLDADLTAIGALDWSGAANGVVLGKSAGVPALVTPTALRSLAPSFPYATDFANVASWRISPEGLWESKPNTSEAVANLKNATDYTFLGGATLVNGSALNAGAYSPGSLTLAVNSAQDWTTGAQTSGYLYWSFPAAYLSDGVGVVAWRMTANNGTGESMAGAIVAKAASPGTNFTRLMAGYTAGSYQGYYDQAGTFITGGGFGNLTAAQATQQAGMWFRILLNAGTATLQTATTNTSDYRSVTGWTTIAASPATGYVLADSLRIGFFCYWASGGPNPATYVFSGFDDTLIGACAANPTTPPGVCFGFPRTRASTAIPVIAQDIGASATYSDAEIIARLARAVNTRTWEVAGGAAIRAYIYRGSAYTQPADGAAWVTYASGTFSGLATVGTGAKLSIWLDYGDANGSKWASFDPVAFGSLGVS